MEDKEKIVREICKKAKDAQLKDFQERMPDNKQGVEVEVNGVKYIAAIRRLTPQECAELQTMPHDYEFVTSETQQYKGLGNGWNIETIKHIFSFIPKDRLSNLKVLSLFDGISGGGKFLYVALVLTLQHTLHLRLTSTLLRTRCTTFQILSSWVA